MKNLMLCLIVASGLAFAGEIGGVTLPDQMKVSDQELNLNGAGLRKKLFIKVYAGGLYTKAKTKDAAAIINADDPMAIRMHFIYDGVSKDKLIGAWNEGFANTAKGQEAALQPHIDAFNALFTETAAKNDVYDVIYEPGKGVSVVINGKTVGTVNGGLPFKKAVFGIWLGDVPADKKLKKGMLGK